MSMTIKQAQYGDSIGTVTVDMGGIFEKCMYNADLLASSENFIGFQMTLTSNTAYCVPSISGQLDFDDTRTATYRENGQKTGILHRVG